MDDNQKTIVLNKGSYDDFIDFNNSHDRDAIIKILNKMMSE